MKEIVRDRNFEKKITDAIQMKSKVIGWQNLNDVISKCELIVKGYKKENNEIDLEISAKSSEKLDMIVSGKRTINFYMPAQSISFVSTIVSLGENGKVKISAPECYQFHERRDNERIQPASVCYVSYEFQKLFFKKSIFDISVGGFSFILTKNDKIHFDKGSVITDVVLEIGRRKIKVKAECVNSMYIDRFKIDNLPYGGHKIAFKFLQISETDKAFLKDMVDKQVADVFPFAVNK